MTKRVSAVVVVFAAVFCLAGVLIASNMVFKFYLDLKPKQTGVSGSGTNVIGLPYNMGGTVMASDILKCYNGTDIYGGVCVGDPVAAVQMFIKSTNGIFSYDGCSGQDFILKPGDGHFLVLRRALGPDEKCVIFGSHDPSLAISLDAFGTNGSLNGANFIAPPYHATASNAEELIADIDAAAGSPVVQQVCEFVESTDGVICYTGYSGTLFALSPGKSYLVWVTADASYIPSHY